MSSRIFILHKFDMDEILEKRAIFFSNNSIKLLEIMFQSLLLSGKKAICLVPTPALAFYIGCRTDQVEIVTFAQDKPLQIPNDVPLHVFGFVAMEESLLRTLLQRKNSYFYFISVCMMFWEDLLSDRDLKKQKLFLLDEASIQKYYKDRHPLLANGVISIKKNLQLIYDTDPHLHEEYLVPQAIVQHSHYKDVLRYEVITVTDSESITFLQMLQADLLTLSYHRQEKLAPINDDTIQIVASPSRLMEVQKLFDFLEKNSSWIDETASVLVHVADLERYLPYIERVFQQNACHMSYEVFGHTPRFSTRTVAHGFFHSLRLHETRVTKDDLIALLHCEALQKKLSLHAEEVHMIEMYIEKSSFREGMNAPALQHVLQQEGIEPVGKNVPRRTWEGLKQDIAQVFMAASAGHRTAFDVSSAEVIGNWAHFMTKLFHDVIHYGKEQKTPLQWKDVFEKHLTTFFQEVADSEYLLRAVHQFAASSDEAVSLSTALQSLEELYKKQKDTQFTKQIVFAPYLALEGHPAMIAAYIGMHDDEGSLKREKNELISLHFAASIHAARRAFYVSYLKEPLQNGLSTRPSQPVIDLIASLEAGFAGDPFWLYHEKKRFPAVRKETKQQATISLNVDTNISEDKQAFYIDIDFLKEAVKNPIKVFLQKNWGVHLSHHRDDEGNYWMDTLSSWIVKKEIVTKEYDAFARSVAEHQTGVDGFLKRSAASSFHAEKERLDRALQEMQVLKSPFIIELMPNCDNEEWITEQRLAVPAPVIDIDGKEHMIVGEIGPCAHDGLIATKKVDTAGMYGLHPELLVLSILGRQTYVYDMQARNKVEWMPDSIVDKLQQHIAYAQECIKYPSLLFPQWIKEIGTSDDPEAFIKKFEHQSMYIDRYLAYFIEIKGLSFIGEYWSRWKAIAGKLYGI